ncbi:MAG: ThuA domain-containing protein [Candidatus Solibacter sp.]|nr:ThuA domain-containing protein [Candidatus Solibacter sp.]
MKNTMIGLLLAAVLACAVQVRAASPIRVMLLDGEQGGPYHAWEETSPYLKKMLGDARIFQVDVVTAPPKGGDFTAFKPDWGKYKVVVANYDVPDERWSDSLKASFELYMRDGGGLVSVHAADNAFPNWKEYNLMIGVGGWRGRNEKSGPHFYYQDGKLVTDNAPGNAGSHGARTTYKVVNQVTSHPITKGLPKEWLHVADELYANMRGPGQNMTVLSTSWSDPANRGTNHEEPILMVLSYGRGRVFHTLMGHDLAALNCVGFIATYQRGTEWAATGMVTQEVPADFPSADKSCTRPEYTPPAGWVSPGGAPRRGAPAK